MLNGDISNQRSLVFGFRCENSLLKYKDSTITDRVLNFFSGKTHRAEINEKVLSLLNYIAYDTEYTAVLVIDAKNYTDEAKDILLDLPINQVSQVIKSPSEITMQLNTGEMTYYIDECEKTRYEVQHRYSLTVDQINQILRRHYPERLT